MCMRFNLFLYGSIDICVSSIYMYAVRFFFVRFDLYERVLKILSVTERHTGHCARLQQNMTRLIDGNIGRLDRNKRKNCFFLPKY